MDHEPNCPAIAVDMSDMGPCDCEDRERFGGPITAGMIHTAILGCANPHLKGNDLGVYRDWVHDAIDMERLAQHINSWLTRVE